MGSGFSALGFDRLAAAGRLALCWGCSRGGPDEYGRLSLSRNDVFSFNPCDFFPFLVGASLWLLLFLPLILSSSPEECNLCDSVGAISGLDRFAATLAEVLVSGSIV